MSSFATRAARRVGAAVTAVVLVAPGYAVLDSANAAPAKASGKITFSFVNKKVDAKQPATLNYSSVGVPSAATFVVQRQFGSANVWRKVASLSGPSGSATVPGVPLGKYLYRIHAKLPGGGAVNSHSHPLFSYGAVPLDQLCNEYFDGFTIHGDNCGDQDTYQIGGTVFTYTASNYAEAAPDYRIVLEAKSSSCRSVDVKWGVPDGYESSQNAMVTLSVIRADADPQRGTIPLKQVGTLHATLNKKAWNIDLSVANNNSNSIRTGFTATLSCYTETALA
jgi:hypothetical protein